jgi:hypothetical protein
MNEWLDIMDSEINNLADMEESERAKHIKDERITPLLKGE